MLLLFLPLHPPQPLSRAMHSIADYEEQFYGLPPPNPTQPFSALPHPYKTNPSSSEILEIQHHTTQDLTYFTTFSTNPSFPHYHHIHPFVHNLSPNTSSHHHNNTNPMGAKEESETIARELRHKRLISNRESARRTRLRRKKQVEELQLQKNQLIATNQKLTDQIINLSQHINQMFQENVQLKEEISYLKSGPATQKTL